MKPKPENKDLVFGKTFTDHMLEIDWTVEKGWHSPVIKPYENFSMSPAVSSLHYGMQCFEGMKAYRDEKNNIRIFRPELNMARMNNSMTRLSMPGFDGDQLIRCLEELLKVEKEWIPQERGYSLYIRPTGISTQPTLGVGAPQECKLYVILSPVGPYYPEGFNPVKLYASKKCVRAWPGGTGDVKIGGNYAATIEPQMDAARKGYTQCLWLFGDDAEVTEVGTMNFFVLWDKADGSGRELLTAPLDGTILPGVTRQTVLDLAREWGEFEVSERVFTMKELTSALDENRVVEAFGCGTAAVVSPIKAIHYEGKEYDVPLQKENPDALAGHLTQKFWDTITGIQYGAIESPYSIVVE